MGWIIIFYKNLRFYFTSFEFSVSLLGLSC